MPTGLSVVDRLCSVLPDRRPGSVGNREAVTYVADQFRESGWTVLDKSAGREVPIEPRHVCLLFRRMQSFEVHGPISKPGKPRVYAGLAATVGEAMLSERLANGAHS